MEVIEKVHAHSVQRFQFLSNSTRLHGQGDKLFIGNLIDVYGSLWNQIPFIWEVYEEEQVYTY